MVNEKEKNTIATEIYRSLNHGQLKDKLDWVDSVSFTIDDRLEALNIKEINDIVEKCKDTKLIQWQISVHNGKLAASVIDLHDTLTH